MNPKTGLIDLESLEESLKKANISRRSGNGVIGQYLCGSGGSPEECHQLAEKYASRW